jgi:DNA-binding CsgD family transcriptional regulator
LNERVGNLTAVTVNLNNIGDVYRKTGRLNEAESFSLKALELAYETQQDYQVKSACRDLSKLYLLRKDFEKAYSYLEKSYDLTDNIFSDQIAEELARSQSLYELQQKQQRITLLESERGANRLITILSVGGIISFLVFGGVLFYQQRTKNRKERSLLEAQAEIAKKELENTQLNEQKLKAELENKLLREEQLKNELDLKSQSLTNSALHMIQKNEFLSEMRSQLKDLKKAQADTVQKKIKRLIKSIDLNFNMDDDWQEFESIFQQVHSDFFRKLNDMYPSLSASEVRLCAMIRLNLQSKDMAAIMGISQDSLRIARYRLRKRLGLERGANLYNFIINIG